MARSVAAPWFPSVSIGGSSSRNERTVGSHRLTRQAGFVVLVALALCNSTALGQEHQESDDTADVAVVSVAAYVGGDELTFEYFCDDITVWPGWSPLLIMCSRLFSDRADVWPSLQRIPSYYSLMAL